MDGLLLASAAVKYTYTRIALALNTMKEEYQLQAPLQDTHNRLLLDLPANATTLEAPVTQALATLQINGEEISTHRCMTTTMLRPRHLHGQAHQCMATPIPRPMHLHGQAHQCMATPVLRSMHLHGETHMATMVKLLVSVMTPISLISVRLISERFLSILLKSSPTWTETHGMLRSTIH